MGGSFIKEADNVAKDILKDFREGIIWVGRLFLGKAADFTMWKT